MEFRREEMLRKYAALRRDYAEPYQPDYAPGDYTVRYAKVPDPCLSSDLLSHRILMHFDAKKALFPRLYAKLPKGANPAAYAQIYFDQEEKLHHIEFIMDESVRYLSFRISEQLMADYQVRDYPSGKSFHSLMGMEWTEFDADGRPVSVESFQRNGSYAEGVIIDCEYYRYENGRLCHADRFDKFDSDCLHEGLTRRLIPDRIMNPEVFAYDFERTAEGILCTRTNYWSASRTYKGSFLMPEKELRKMEKNGIHGLL